ncbi:MAG: response regulator transcription factor [candidate division WOR-3 bacterium]|jgi:two-component system phosphate regulon response regulator PhoB/two-component system alkaline phosphatase synthesis response regulator PhoP
MGKLIAVVDDEPDILELVSIHLRKANFTVETFQEADSFFKFLNKTKPDLLILDLMLPDSDGMDICRYMKKKEQFSSVPIIMLTAKSDETDKVLGLEMGADDYVTKPFSPRELVARVKAVLRRRERVEDERIEIGKILEILPKKFLVRVEGKRVDLTTTEFKILKAMATRIGWVFSREQLLDELWGHDKIVIDRTIDVHIKHLRAKLGKAARFIKNIRGMGYKLEP